MHDTLMCELLSHTNAEHLQQLYTGFSMLHRKGTLQFIQRISRADIIDTTKPPHLLDVKYAHCKVVVNDNIVLYYDVHDSFEIDPEDVRNVDFYFKRSYSDKEVQKINDKGKIFPLGLNYLVCSSGIDTFSMRRRILHTGREKLLTLGRALGIDYVLGGKTYVPRVEQFDCSPTFTLPPKIVFMVRAWDHRKAASKDKADAIESMNQTRAHCIRVLKKEFGQHFVGGFLWDEYTKERFRDCLLQDNTLARKHNYMHLLREFPIGIATTGLHGSIGWKLAEYVASAKAIVTEKLNYRVPGPFANEQNYLDFVTPDGCVDAAARVFDDHHLRCQLMINNYRYYHAYVRPDALVLNTLAIALGADAVPARQETVQR